MTDVFLLALLALWVAADTTAFGQILVSQPLVAGWLAGWVFGEPAAGLGVGILLQWAWAGVFPLGGATFPWSGPATVTAGAIAAQAMAGGSVVRWGGVAFPGALALAAALGAALLVGEIGRHLITALRRRRDRAESGLRKAMDRGDGAWLLRWHWKAGMAETVSGAALCLAMAAAGTLGVRYLAPMEPRDGALVALTVLGAGVGGAAASMTRTRRDAVIMALAGSGVVLWRVIS